MGKQILLTGGAGFIGSHVAARLLQSGYSVRVLDSLISQVHGSDRRRPEYLAREVELQVGDVRDPAAVKRALHGVDAVYHFAARVGVGQSMYEVSEYTSVNTVGTAVLLEELLHHPVERLVVASSMSIYGEGPYRKADGTPAEVTGRTPEQIQRGEWEMLDESGQPLIPVPTPESKPPSLNSVYALSKWDQEQMCLILGRAYGIPTVALRFFNVYGPFQALSNPYTGVLAIFASRLLNNKPPLINEDGLQQRDFLSVYDVAQACQLALEAPASEQRVFNIASGNIYTIRGLAMHIARALGKEHLQPEITGKYRAGDIRHCIADISAARQQLGYEPRVELESGLIDLAEWLGGQSADDLVMQSRAELAQRGLMV